MVEDERIEESPPAARDESDEIESSASVRHFGRSALLSIQNQSSSEREKRSHRPLAARSKCFCASSPLPNPNSALPMT